MLRAVTSLAIGLLLIAVCKSDNTTSTSPSAMSLLYKAIVSCADGNTFSCLRKRTVLLLDRASNLDKLSLWGDTLVLVKSSFDNTTTADFSTDRSVRESFTNFLDSHRIQLRLPRLSYFLPYSEGSVTGRGKKNRGYGLLAMTIIGAMLAMGMAGLAAMAGKALAASMAALMMAAMAALKKGGGGGGHGGHSSYEVISIPSHHHHRSFLEEQQMNSPYRYDTESHVHHDTR